MRRFKYVLKDSNKTIEQVAQHYCDIIIANLNSNIKYDSNILKDIILCAPEKMNEKEHTNFMKRLRPKTYKLVSRINILFNVFFGNEYSELQPVISEFISKNFTFKICPYCGIDYVNSFKECLSYYCNYEDFLLNSRYKELIRLQSIGEITAKKILKDRIELDSTVFKEKYSKYESSFKNLKLKPKFHNHFTLDHIIPKSKYPLFQISLYNLVPVCYSCNTKFKGVYELSESVIPNSNSYKLDEVLKFCLINEDDTCKIDYKLINSEDPETIIDYMKEFKIIGRYNEHVDVVLKLKENASKYNKQKITEISRQTGISVDELKIIIFGNDVFKGESDSHLFKLKTDISTDLGII